MAVIKPPLFLLNLRQKRVLIKFFIIFYLLTIIPIAISSLVIYHYSNAVIENEIRQSNNAAQNNMIRYIDERLQNLKKNVYVLSTNAYLNDIQDSTADLNAKWYDLRMVQAELDKLRGSDEMIYDAVIYFSNINFLINGDGSHMLEHYFNEFNKLDGLDSAAWKDYFSQTHNFQIQGTRTVTSRTYNSSKTSKVITILNSFPYYLNYSKPKATLAIFIKEDRIKKTVEDYNTRKNMFLMIDRQGNIITQYGKDIVFDKADAGRIMSAIGGRQSGSFYIPVNGKDLSITFQSSSLTGWSYLSAVPVSDISAQSMYIRSITFFVCMLFVLIGLVMSVWLSGVMYKPISTLVEYLNSISAKNKKKDGNTVQNEFVFIKSQFSEICQANEKLAETLNGGMPLLHEYLFFWILKGNISSSEYEDILNQYCRYNIKLSGDKFIVVTVIVDFYEELMRTDVSQESRDDIRKKIKSVITAMIAQKFNCFTVGSDISSISYIINFDYYPSAEEDIAYTCSKIKDCFNSAGYNMRLSIGVGDICGKITEIRSSYSQSVEALRYRSVKAESQLILYRDMKEKQKSFHYENIDVNSITNCLFERKFDRGLNGAVEILKKCISGDPPYESINKVEMLLIKAAASVLEAKGYSLNQAGLSEEHIYEDIRKLNFAEEYEGYLRDTYKRIVDLIKEKTRSRNDETVNSVIKYMEENYNREIYLESIANELNMNYTYLSRIFKDTTGLGFPEYLGRIRIEKSKELLKETDKAVFEICAEIGYVDTNSFIKKFKKFEGITPGKYREFMWQK